MFDLEIKYILHLKPDEWRLISKALAGTLNEEEKVEARALQDHLFQERNKRVKNWSETILNKKELYSSGHG